MENDMNTHNITMLDRKNLSITGVKKIDNFNTDEFLISTTMGYLSITGKDLELIKLDTDKGNISIRGLINSFNYKENIKNKKEESILTKLFK